MSAAYAAAKYCRLVVVPCTAALTAIAWALILFAVALPSWLYVELADLGQIHLHGLWLDCIEGITIAGGYAMNPMGVAGQHCTYKFDNPSLSSYNPTGIRGNDFDQHKFQGRLVRVWGLV